MRKHYLPTFISLAIVTGVLFRRRAKARLAGFAAKMPDSLAN